MKNLLIIFFLSVVGSSCAVSKNFNVNTKYGADKLQEDYDVFRNVLEDAHPGLYWYTPKDSMNFYFEKGKSLIKDSMTESQFRLILNSVISKIKCGHTTVKASKQFVKQTNRNLRSFPLLVKLWTDTALVTFNLNRNDSVVNRGVILTSIDNKPMDVIIDSMFHHLSADGFNLTHKYQTLSNGNMFAAMYGALYGLKQKHNITYIDSTGQKRSASVTLYQPPKPDSTKKPPTPLPPQPSKKERKARILKATRDLSFDTTNNVAIMSLNTFTKGYKLPKFFKKSFRELNKNNTQNLVIDLRGNGGGSVTNSNLLTKYLADKPFKIADSLYAIKRSSPFGKYQNTRFFNWLFLVFMTKKREDGNYHFRMFEKKFFKPKKKDHFDGHVYILTGGNTFSAATLVTGVLKNQENVTVVGEETGGGAYGNNAWIIPDITLPNTKVRFRLPLFRLVIDNDLPKDGRGVMPEAYAPPTVEDIRNNKDFKMKKVLELLKTSEN